ncbi:hypothetical protein ABZU32_35565 [Sphaerisporangium sp. NPDC005288]|uniref:hypothetical protein n=1 Tax=Sphaerisporangium sp. NPDC005288 TaxID=3155114 RepID=UPI0033A20E21
MARFEGPHRRARDRDEGHRTARVNLRLSAGEYAEIAAAAENLTMAAFVADAALSAAREEFPPDTRAAVHRLFRMEHRLHAFVNMLKELAKVDGGEQLRAKVAEISARARQSWNLLDETVTEFWAISQNARGRRTRRRRRGRQREEQRPAPVVDADTEPLGDDDPVPEFEAWYEP